MSDIEALEHKVRYLTEQALLAAHEVDKVSPTRENSLCITQLEYALFRSEQDLDRKGVVYSMT